MAAAVVGLLALGGRHRWAEHQRAERRALTAAAVDEALAEAARLRAEAEVAPPGEVGKWGEALSAARRAEALLAQGEADAAARGRVVVSLARIARERNEAGERSHRLAADRALLAELESVRGDRAIDDDLRLADTEYAAAFRRAGLDFQATEPAEAGRQLASRSGRVELAGYLDDWACRPPAGDPGRAETTGRTWWRRRGGPTPTPGATPCGAQLVADGGVSLPKFATWPGTTSRCAAQPPSSQVLLARELLDGGVEGDGSWPRGSSAGRPPAIRGLLGPRRAGPRLPPGRETFPASERGGGPPDRRDGRPAGERTSAHNALGLALKAKGELPEAVAEFRESLRLKPDNPGPAQPL